jgi:hypothetical protein
VLQNDIFSNSLCQNCWTNINNFHIFYCDIENKQSCCILKDPEEVKFFPFENKDDLLPEIVIKTERLDPDYDPNGDNKDDTCGNLEEKFAVNRQQSPRMTRSKRNIDDTKALSKEKKPAKRLKKDQPIKPTFINTKSREIIEKCRETLESSIKEYCKMECVQCANVSFSKWLELKKHYRDEHQIPGYVFCCNKKFERQVKLLEHIAWHMNPEVFRYILIGNKFGVS